MRNKIGRGLRYLAVICCCVLAFAAIVATGGGGGGGGEQLPPSQNVTISGRVDDGTANSPIPNASCRFVETGQKVHATGFSNSNGEYRMIVPPGVEGHVMCSPENLSYFQIYTYSSTKGRKAGEKISGENVTPVTTIVADIIQAEKPSDPIARKQELLESIETLPDDEIARIASVSTTVANAMYQHGVDVRFGGVGGGEGNGASAGGVDGNAGDGAVSSPIPNARCEFIVGTSLKDSKVLYSAALADLLEYGRINRSDMNKIADLVNSALEKYTPEEIKAAFSKFFADGIGKQYSTIAGEDGSYFLPIPPNLPGMVRCIPPGQEKLVLGTYVKGREANERLSGQDVNPATTVFSNNIVSKLDGDLASPKDNFLEDIKGLVVSMVLEGGGVDSFELTGMPANVDVGMVAFTATSLFNIFYKNGINGDYLSALDDVAAKQVIRTDFLQTLGLPSSQANIVVRSADNAAGDLSAAAKRPVDLGTGFSTSRINVRVTDTPGGQLIAGANVTITELPSGVLVSYEEGDNPKTLGLTGVPAEGDVKVTVGASNLPGSAPITKEVSVVQFATVDLEIPLSTTFPLQVQIGGTGHGFVTSSPVGVDCGTHENERAGTQCTAAFDSGTQVTLSASPVWNSQFVGWSGGNCSGTGVCIVTLEQAITVTATFRTVEITAPTVEITAPTSSSTYSVTSGYLNIGGTASDDRGVTSVTWSNSRGGSGTCTGTTSWSASNISLSGGTNVITVTARDAAGKTGTDTLTVTADITAPTITITSPTSSSTYSVTSGYLNIGGTASDDVGVTSVTWSNSRGSSGTCSGTTSWSASGIVLFSGTNVITVTASDASGKTGTDTLTVFADITTPTITITSPTSSSTYTVYTSSSVGSLNIGGTASDDVGVTSVTWGTNAGGSGTCTGTTSWSASNIPLYFLYSGDNEITVTAHDAAGKTGTDKLTVILKTNSAPTISNAEKILEQVKYSGCSLWGTTPDKLGTLFTITFDYTDSNGNGPTTSSEAELYCAWDFPYGEDFASATSATLTGDGFSGAVRYSQCIGFGSNSQVEVTMTIKDLLDATSNSLKLIILRPSGAN